jgi:hypothetical protein
MVVLQHTAEGDAVDFLVRAELLTPVTERDIAEDAGVVVIVVAAEAVDELAVDLGVFEAFEDFVLGGGGIAGGVDGLVDAGLAEEHHATPDPDR